jgi:acyl-coenzyme A thioesterase PaaI-like protein
VTAALEVVYLKPTPVATELVIRARPLKIEDRKVIVEASLTANGVETVRGTVVAAPLPASMAGGHGRL